MHNLRSSRKIINFRFRKQSELLCWLAGVSPELASLVFGVDVASSDAFSFGLPTVKQLARAGREGGERLVSVAASRFWEAQLSCDLGQLWIANFITSCQLHGPKGQ